MATECLWPCVLYQWHWLLLFSVGSSLDIRVSTVISSLFPPSPPRCNLLAWVPGSQTMFCAKITVRCRARSGGPLSWLPQTAHGFYCPLRLLCLLPLCPCYSLFWHSHQNNPTFLSFNSPSSWACSFIQNFCHFNRILKELKIIIQNTNLNSVFY